MNSTAQQTEPNMNKPTTSTIPVKAAPRPAKTERVAVVRTSDRGLYKSCRRKWVFASHLNMGYEPVGIASPLWFGSAIHFALEDFHGLKHYPTSTDAFNDYARSSQLLYPKRLPQDFKELITLGHGMLGYYNIWLNSRDPLQTYIYKGHPQVEVTFEIELPISPHILKGRGYDRCIYRGTIDRIAYDPLTDFLWPIDYKTAKRFETLHFGIDPQVTAYCWACYCIYKKPTAGLIYQQHLKEVPAEPRILISGKVSADKHQNTTHRAYRSALINLYGDITKVPAANIECLNHLTSLESTEADEFVRRDRVYRNPHQIESEGVKILMEVEEMLNLNTPMYPHASRNCTMCAFQSPCISVDDGSDWESELAEPSVYQQRDLTQPASSSPFMERKEDIQLWQLHTKHPLRPALHQIKLGQQGHQ